jgi:hypothetical protein
MLVQPVALNQEALDSLARHRVQVQSTSSTTIKLPRKRRTCRKCALLTCPGSQRVNNCQNPCRDCKKVDCVTMLALPTNNWHPDSPPPPPPQHCLHWTPILIRFQAAHRLSRELNAEHAARTLKVAKQNLFLKSDLLPTSYSQRACSRCKSPKVKCESKTETDPCKHCFNGGHECIIPGKKIRKTPP